jgi:hypothetical protein
LTIVTVWIALMGMVYVWFEALRFVERGLGGQASFLTPLKAGLPEK